MDFLYEIFMNILQLGYLLLVASIILQHLFTDVTALFQYNCPAGDHESIQASGYLKEQR